jgi:TRAP-type C4-dicarboxylate transport system permease small subunit
MQCLKCGYELDPDRVGCPLCSTAPGGGGGKFGRFLSRAEESLLVLFLGVMVVMVIAQILLRNLCQSGIMGGDDLVRHLVLWIAFFGAGISTRSSSHVKIDVLTNFMPEGFRRYADIAVNLFSCLICAILVAASARFIHFEYQGQVRSSFLNIPLWVMAIVLPVGYAIISLRFALNSLSAISGIIRRRKR